MTKYTIRDKNDKKVYIIKEKVKDAALEITIKNQDDYDEIDIIAKKLHLGFYKTKGNKAVLKGHRKDLEKYVDLVYGGDTSIKEKVKDSTIKDSREALEYLIKEEEQAINDYKKAIIESTDVKELDLYTHILREEIEHLNELKAKLASTKDIIEE